MAPGKRNQTMNKNHSTAESRRRPVFWRGYRFAAIVVGLVVQFGLLARGATPTLAKGLSTGDWAGIRAAYRAHQHEVVAVEGGYRTHNPGQQWRTDFDPRGFVTQPEAGGWQWGLELKSYGFSGHKREIGKTWSVKAMGDRIIYQRDAGLLEWMVNDRRGLEHGFTLAQAPASALGRESELEFDLAVRGSLRPELAAANGALRFVDAEGATVVTYSGLKVWDAEGRSLPARFLVLDDGVRLLVKASGARYPITIDPIAQQAYLKASNTEANDRFGYSVAVWGDTVVVGAYGEASNATGVNGEQSDNSAGGAGAAYVFVRSGHTWTQQAYLKASNTDTVDFFGQSVAISGETIVVGAYGESSNATGVNGDQSNNSAPAAGAAYVFVRNGAKWLQQAYLKASNTSMTDYFGFAVSISSETIVVGAYDQDGSAGAAYVFARNGVTWTQQAYLKASNAEAMDLFAASVAISGDTVVVGASREASGATGVNGDQSDNSTRFAGAAYVFVRDGATWTQEAYLKASNSGEDDVFGSSVAISCDTIAIGAPGEASNAIGVNGDQSNNFLLGAGAAYVFVRSGMGWVQQAYLKASNTNAGDSFGGRLAIFGDTLAVSAALEDSSATGINGKQADNGAIGSGAVYLFVRRDDSWEQNAYVKASNTDPDDSFGFSVAVSEGTIVVGAYGEASSATGSNGNQSNNDATNAGAAYIFPVPTTTLGNISTRLRVETGDNVLIGGFIITGTQAKKVLLRAIGPSLPLTGKLENPCLELRDDMGTLIASNDNWMNSPEKQEIIDSLLAPTNDFESAILRTLDPGLYTALMRGINSMTGIGLVEAYDLDNTVDSELANISTRGLVQTGDNIMIGGFILQGPSARDTLIRAIGPSIPLPGALADPTLDLFDANGVLLNSNDDWRDTLETEIMGTMIPPTDEAESAIFATLGPGAYTAIVRGKNGSTGIALVEVYALSP